jgi:hypothetical protein
MNNWKLPINDFGIALFDFVLSKRPAQFLGAQRPATGRAGRKRQIFQNDVGI